MIFNVPVAVLGGGYAAPAAFLIATIALTIFSVGYIEMSRRVHSAGGFYAFITRGLGSVMGLGNGVFIALCYLIFTCAVLGMMSYFAATSIDAWTGVDLPAYVYMALGLLVMTSLAFFHIELTAKILGVALVSEVLALLVLSAGIIGHGGGPDGFEAAPLNPFDLVRQQRRDRRLRRGRDRHRHLRRVLVLGRLRDGPELRGGVPRPEADHEARDVRVGHRARPLLHLLLVHVRLRMGPQGAAAGVNAQFSGQYRSAWYPLTDRFVGSGLTTIFEAIAITSSFACAWRSSTPARRTSSRWPRGVLPRRWPDAPVAPEPLLRGDPVGAFVCLYCSASSSRLEHRGRAAKLGT